MTDTHLSPPEYVTGQQDEGLRIITLNRPDRLNALSGALMQQLLEQVLQAGQDHRTRAVLLCAAGRGFCAGGDLKSGAVSKALAAEMNQDDRVHLLRQQMRSAELLHSMPKPTVTALRGAVMGGGVGLALSADFRIASESTIIDTAFLPLGFSGDFGSSFFLTRLAGVNQARSLMMRPRRLKAQEALQLGLLSEVVPDEELDARALQVGRELAAGPTVALQHMKRNLMAAADGASVGQLMDMEARAMVHTSQSADHQEAIQAMLGKRQPQFTGR